MKPLMLKRAFVAAMAIGGLSLIPAAHADTPKFDIPDSLKWTIPPEFDSCAARLQDAERYTVYDRINPFYLRLDLDGDKKPDTALLIERKRDRKGGILVCFGNGTARVIFAGRKIADIGGGPMDDLKFGEDVDLWGAYSGKAPQFPELPPPPRQRGELLFFGRSEAWGRFIFWTGTDFVTYQNGD